MYVAVLAAFVEICSLLNAVGVPFQQLTGGQFYQEFELN